MQFAKRWPWIAAGVAAVAVGIIVVLTRPGEDTSALLLNPNVGGLIAEGRQLYDANCASCHGVDLKGEPNWQTRLPNGRLPAPPHDANGHTWHHAEQMLFEITKYGVQKFAGEGYETDMPAYEDILTDEEIIALLSYIKSRWPTEIRERHDQMTVEAAGN